MRSVISTVPFLYILITSICMPAICAEAGLVPWADAGIKHTCGNGDGSAYITRDSVHYTRPRTLHGTAYITRDRVHYTGPRTLHGTAYITRDGVHYTGRRTLHGTAYITRDRVQYTEPRTLHGTAYITRDRVHYTGPRTLHGTEYITRDRVHYTGPRTVHGTAYITRDRVHYTGPRTLHGTAYITRDRDTMALWNLSLRLSYWFQVGHNGSQAGVFTLGPAIEWGVMELYTTRSINTECYSYVMNRKWIFILWNIR